ncbi:MAG: cyclase family protein, partial [Betaproteobacteria bacterium]
MQNKRWQNRPPGSNWGEFGPDDQRGRMNWVTREKVLQGVAEVREGLTFVLSLPLDYPGGNGLNPRRHPPRIAATHRNGRQNFAYEVRQDNPDQIDVVCDDIVLLTLQYSTQWDSFAHVGALFDADGNGKPEPMFYNGFRAGEHIKPAPRNPEAESWNLYEGTRAEALGIQNLAEHGAQGRGVMIDL